MLVNIYYSSSDPNRVIYVSESNKFNSVEHCPGIEKRTNFLKTEQKNIIDNTFSWIVDPIEGIKLITDPPSAEETLMLENKKIKIRLLEKLWIYFNFSKKNLFDSIMISDLRNDIIEWEISQYIVESNSLIAYLSSLENITTSNFLEIEQIRKETYFKKIRELYISCIDISNTIINSKNPIEDAKLEFVQLMGKRL